MKRVISLMLTALMVLSSINVAFAAEVPTVAISDVDVTSVAEGATFYVPVTIDKFPEGKVCQVNLSLTFDTTKLEFVSCTNRTTSGRSMRIWDPKWEEWSNATWSADAEGVNAHVGAVSYLDQTGGTASFTAESIADTTTLVFLEFRKKTGATETTEIGFSEIVLIDVATNTEDGVAYKLTREEIKDDAGTITLTAGPKDKVETVGTTYTGDLGEVVDGDTTDVATAIYAELNGDTDTTYKKVNWTVNATIDEKAVVGTYTSDVNLSGEATYYLGMVIQGLAQDTVTAVAAALAE